jgi:hypothetical protein
MALQYSTSTKTNVRFFRHGLKPSKPVRIDCVDGFDFRNSNASSRVQLKQASEERTIMDAAAPAWTGILCIMMLATMVLAGIVMFIVVTRQRKRVATSDELAELRDEVAQLRDEVERLKRTRWSGSTDIKE